MVVVQAQFLDLEVGRADLVDLADVSEVQLDDLRLQTLRRTVFAADRGRWTRCLGNRLIRLLHRVAAIVPSE